MNTHNQMMEIIGEPLESVDLHGRFGNAVRHANGYWSGDPCYLPDGLNKDIMRSHAEKYPWEGRDYGLHASGWFPFEVHGHTLFARSYSDGSGGFAGHSVDAGWVVIWPAAFYDPIKARWYQLADWHEDYTWDFVD